MGFHGPVLNTNSDNDKQFSQENIVQPVLGNTVNVMGYTSTPTTHGEKVLAQGMSMSISSALDKQAADRSSNASILNAESNSPAMISSESVHVNQGDASNIVQLSDCSTHSVDPAMLPPNKSATESRTSVIPVMNNEEENIPHGNETGVGPSLTDNSSRQDPDTLLSSASIQVSHDVLSSHQNDPTTSVSNAPSISSHAGSNIKSDVKTGTLPNMEMKSVHPNQSEIGDSVQHDITESEQHTLDEHQIAASNGNQYDDAPYSYADDDSFNISDEASDSFDSELSDPMSRKVIQVKESTSALDSNTESNNPELLGKSNSAGSPKKNMPIIIPGES